MRYDGCSSDMTRRQLAVRHVACRRAAPPGARARVRRSCCGAPRSCRHRSCPRTARGAAMGHSSRSAPPAPSNATPSSARSPRASDHSTFITEPSTAGFAGRAHRCLDAFLQVPQDLLARVRVGEALPEQLVVVLTPTPARAPRARRSPWPPRCRRRSSTLRPRAPRVPGPSRRRSRRSRSRPAPARR